MINNAADAENEERGRPIGSARHRKVAGHGGLASSISTRDARRRQRAQEIPIAFGMATARLPGGPTLNYREWGRPPVQVLLLHGLTSSSQSWRNVAPVLGEHFRVIARTPAGMAARVDT